MPFISTTIKNAKALLQNRIIYTALAVAAFLGLQAVSVFAADGGHQPGGEANLKLPDLSKVNFLGINGHNLLLVGIVVSALGLVLGLLIFMNLKKLPVHQSMRDISELIYETCKTYLITQGKFILILEVFIAVIIILYFGVLSGNSVPRVIIILIFSLIGIGGSY